MGGCQRLAHKKIWRGASRTTLKAMRSGSSGSRSGAIRRHAEKLLTSLLATIRAEIGLMEKRMLAKLEDIDTSVGLVAGELGRRSSDPPPPLNDAGS